MYTPAHFAETDLSKLHAAIESYSFGTLISRHEEALTASHLPLLLKRDGGTPAQFGTLLGHMAKANTQWEQGVGKEVLAIFSGPHAYISPTWYQEEKTVPTWNYLAVHAYGRLDLVRDSREKLDILRQTVHIFMSGICPFRGPFRRGTSTLRGWWTRLWRSKFRSGGLKESGSSTRISPLPGGSA
jgi:transcriptional regulator